MVKISLRGSCKAVQVTPANGTPGRGIVHIELDHSIPLKHERYDIQFFVPEEFASLLKVGASVAITLEQ
ncbi:MAG: hypothetical protein ABSA32_13135 [Candidatus Acidiferrales bacterium]|jgi:hypothetical protein